MAGYVGNPDFRGWLAADPNKQWALDFAGNDPDFQAGGGINNDAIRALSEGVGSVIGPGVPGGGLPSTQVADTIKGYWNNYNQQVLGASTTTPGIAGGGQTAAQLKAAQDAAKAAALRGNITNLVNQTKDIFNGRYGLVDQAAAEQTGKLNQRFGDESKDVTDQVVNESNAAGGAFAARGTRDSSDYGNAVDSIKQGGEKQIRTLGTELEENLGKIGAYASSEKAKFDAEKGGLDAIVSHLAESTDPDELTTVRNQLDAKIAELKAGAADYNTNAQNKAALEQAAPSSKRTQQLVTTLQSIIGSSADAGLKKTIAERLISSANISTDDANKLLSGINAQIDDQLKQQQQV